jgi:hypothetical protein
VNTLNTEKPTFILGHTTRSYLLLDLDGTTLHNVLGLIREIMATWRNVGDALIMYSSKCTGDAVAVWHPNSNRFSRHGRQNFHVIFSNAIGYARAVKIILTLFEFGVLNEDYVDIRTFRGDMTLRVSSKVLQERTMPKPRPVAYVENRSIARTGRGITAYQTLYNYA